jgi:hypothetical protein
MHKWEKGPPSKRGWYLLEFEEGDRFVVAELQADGDLRNEVDGGLITDEVKQHLEILSPK